MAFPLRLTADLLVAFAARTIGSGYSQILRVSSDKDFDSVGLLGNGNTGNFSALQQLPRVSRSASRIIWIANSESFEPSRVIDCANTAAASGRYVFLETFGASLKRRLHEFQPSSRFYFTIRFDCGEQPNGTKPDYGVPIGVGFEAIRMARLAGFFVCAHLVLHDEAGASQLEKVFATTTDLRIDGVLVTAAIFSPELNIRVTRMRRDILSSRWVWLSSLLDPRTTLDETRITSDLAPAHLPNSQQDGFPESAEVQ